MHNFVAMLTFKWPLMCVSHNVTFQNILFAKFFATMFTLERFLVVVNSNMQHQCGYCVEFLLFFLLKIFVNFITIIYPNSPFKCEHCGKQFNDPSAFKRHLKILTGERPYKYQHCDKKFVNTRNLSRHIRVHSGENPFECKRCEKRFANEKSLKCKNKFFCFYFSRTQKYLQTDFVHFL